MRREGAGWHTKKRRVSNARNEEGHSPISSLVKEKNGRRAMEGLGEGKSEQAHRRPFVSERGEEGKRERERKLPTNMVRSGWKETGGGGSRKRERDPCLPYTKEVSREKPNLAYNKNKKLFFFICHSCS